MLKTFRSFLVVATLLIPSVLLAEPSASLKVGETDVEIRNGDVLLIGTMAKAPDSRFQEFLKDLITQGKYKINHGALFSVRDGQITKLEATGTGQVSRESPVTTLSFGLSFEDTTIIILRPAQATPEQKAAAVDYARAKLIGIDYDLDPTTEDKTSCTEFVVTAYKAAGVELVADSNLVELKPLPFGDVSQGALLKLLRRQAQGNLEKATKEFQEALRSDRILELEAELLKERINRFEAKFWIHLVYLEQYVNTKGLMEAAPDQLKSTVRERLMELGWNSNTAEIAANDYLKIHANSMNFFKELQRIYPENAKKLFSDLYVSLINLNDTAPRLNVVSGKNMANADLVQLPPIKWHSRIPVPDSLVGFHYDPQWIEANTPFKVVYFHLEKGQVSGKR